MQYRFIYLCHPSGIFDFVIMIITETPRLIIREFTNADGEFIIELLNTASWLKYIGDRKVKNIEDAQAYLSKGPMKGYKEYGFGLNCVVLKEGNLPIGMCGLIKRETLQDVDIGFAFLPQYEGKGYARESTMAVLDQAKQLELKRLVAITLPDNERSIRLLESVNMHFEKMIQFPDEKEKLMLFAIELTK